MTCYSAIPFCPGIDKLLPGLAIPFKLSSASSTVHSIHILLSTILHTYLKQAHHYACSRKSWIQPSESPNSTPRTLTTPPSPSHGALAQCNPACTDRAPRLAFARSTTSHRLKFRLFALIPSSRSRRFSLSQPGSSTSTTPLPDIHPTSGSSCRGKRQGDGDCSRRWSAQMSFETDMAGAGCS